LKHDEFNVIADIHRDVEYSYKLDPSLLNVIVGDFCNGGEADYIELFKPFKG
jgi:hypothetical protein